VSVRRIVAASVAALAVLATPLAARGAADPAHDYLLGCGGCHGLDGAGSARVPPLRGVDRLLMLPGGREYVLRVPGVASAPLSDARLAALLEWVFGEFGNAAHPRFTADEVGAARAKPLLDPKAARAALD
jgi:mono/diheme cytochrome c family protein